MCPTPEGCTGSRGHWWTCAGEEGLSPRSRVPRWGWLLPQLSPPTWGPLALSSGLCFVSLVAIFGDIAIESSSRVKGWGPGGGWLHLVWSTLEKLHSARAMALGRVQSQRAHGGVPGSSPRSSRGTSGMDGLHGHRDRRTWGARVSQQHSGLCGDFTEHRTAGVRTDRRQLCMEM